MEIFNHSGGWDLYVYNNTIISFYWSFWTQIASHFLFKNNKVGSQSTAFDGLFQSSYDDLQLEFFLPNFCYINMLPWIVHVLCWFNLLLLIIEVVLERLGWIKSLFILCNKHKWRNSPALYVCGHIYELNSYGPYEYWREKRRIRMWITFSYAMEFYGLWFLLFLWYSLFLAHFLLLLFFHFSKEVIANELEEIERDEKVRFKWFKGETCMLLESRKVEKMQVCRNRLEGGGVARLKMSMVVMKM